MHPNSTFVFGSLWFGQAIWAAQVAPEVKNPSANAGDSRDTDIGLNPGSGRCPGGGNPNPLQYSCPENPKKRGAWQCSVHRVTKSQTQLKWLSMQHAHIISGSGGAQILEKCWLLFQICVTWNETLKLSTSYFSLVKLEILILTGASVRVSELI